MDFFGPGTRLLQGARYTLQAKVQYFNVICPLGHRVRGRRTLGYQALRCPACGEGVFVLPVSPLPDPAPPTQPRRSRTAVTERAVIEGPVELKDPTQATVDFGDEDEGLDQVDIVWDDGRPSQTPAPPRRHHRGLGSSQPRLPGSKPPTGSIPAP